MLRERVSADPRNLLSALIFSVFALVSPMQTIHAQPLLIKNEANSPDVLSVFEKILALAESGEPEAQYYMGLLYGREGTAENDPSLSRSWYQKAAEQGHPEALYELGMLYSREAGGFFDMTQALELLRRSSDLGNSYASNNLANFLLHERGSQKDYQEAKALLLKAALALNGGHAETTLGWSYFTGMYSPAIPQDYDLAVYWTKAGALEGHANAYSNLALQYFTGLGVGRDYQAMLRNLIRSADAFGEDLAWVTASNEDEWEAFKHLGPATFWPARELYWQVISNQDEDAFLELLGLLDTLETAERTSSSGKSHSLDN